MSEEKKNDITYYRFMSEVRAFLAKLLNSPISAKPSKYLRDRDVTKQKLIKDLMARDVLERHEKILDSTNSDEKKAKYVVKYKVKKKDFENKIHKIYIKYFEKNVNESVFADEEDMKEQILNGPDGDVYRKRGGINEEGEGGGMAAGGAAGSGGATSTFSVGAETSRGDIGFDVPFGEVQRRVIGGRPKEKKKGKDIKPENILGKTIKAEGKMRKIYITESQYQKILSEELGGATTIGQVASGTDNGDLGYPKPGAGLVLTTPDGKPDKSGIERKPGFSVERIDDVKNAKD